jgi:hypothetical protein
MSNVIKIKGKLTSGAPALGDFDVREMVYVIPDQALYIKTNAGTITHLGGIEKANIGSPAFSGVPTAPTAAFNTNTTQIATTAYVKAALADFSATADGPRGHITVSLGGNSWQVNNNVLAYNKLVQAPANTFLGNDSGATRNISTITTTDARTMLSIDNVDNTSDAAKFIIWASNDTPVANSGNGSAGTGTNFSRDDHVHPVDTSRAPLASPTFTGLVIMPSGTTSQAGGLRLQSGSLKTSPVTGDSGSIEYNGTNLSIIDSTGSRRTFTYTTDTYSGSLTSSQITTGLGYTPAISGQLSLYAPLASPSFTGNPTAPTPSGSDNSTKIATTAFVQGLITSAGLGDMLKSVYDSNDDGKVNSADSADNALALGGSAASNYALKTYVDNAISSLVNSAPGALDTLKELADALGNDANFSSTITSALAAKLDASSVIDGGTYS